MMVKLFLKSSILINLDAAKEYGAMKKPKPIESHEIVGAICVTY